MTSILHLDTSGPQAIVMLAIDGKPVRYKISEGERDHASKLNAIVDEVLEGSGLSLEQLSAFAVCNGPGSYTGLRIGLATAKGYCYVFDKPLITHNRLNLMLLELATVDKEKEHNRLAILPARTGEYYAAADGVVSFPPKHFLKDELAGHYINCARSVSAIGYGAEELSIGSLSLFITHDHLNLDSWAAAGHQFYLEKKFADLAYVEPEYLKSAYITASRGQKNDA